MKNSMKFCAPLFAVLGLLIVTGCQNVISPPPAKAGLQITVSGGNAGTRTLFPDSKFVEYVLSFEYEDTSKSHGDETLPAGTPSVFVTGLADGDWTITAVGMVSIDGTLYPAAEGSETITVNSGAFDSIDINISPSQGGDDGFFTWSVIFPDSVENALLRLEEYGGSWSDSYNLLDDPEATVSLSPGYYIMNLYLKTEDSSKARAEVVHIYSNMETRALYEFVEQDFTQFITVSGTVNIVGSTKDLEYMRIKLYRDANYNDSMNCEFFIDLGDNSWELQLPAFDKDLTLYLRAEGEDEDYQPFHADAGSITVKDQDKSGVVLTVNLGIITLSGTVKVNKAVNGLHVYIYRDSDYNEWLGDSGVDTFHGSDAWSIEVPAFDTDTELYLKVEVADTNGAWYYRKADSITVKNTDKDNITLALNYITLSGTLNVIEGDDEYSYFDVNFGETEYDWDFGYVEIDENDGSFSLEGLEYNQNTTLYVSAYITFEGGTTMISLGTVTVKDANVNGINHIVDLSQLLTISGSVKTDVPVDEMNINIYHDADLDIWMGDVDVDIYDNTWSIKMQAFVQDTPIYFQIEYKDTNGVWYYGVDSITVRDTDKVGIEIVPAVSPGGGYITLSGTIETTVSGLTDVWVYAETYEDSWGGPVNLVDKTWTLQIPKFSGKKAIEFYVQYDNGTNWYNDFSGKRIIVTGQDVSGIKLSF